MTRQRCWLYALALFGILTSFAHAQEPPTELPTTPPPRPALGFQPDTAIDSTPRVPQARPVGPLFSLRHDIGDGVGFRNGFTYVEGWIPILQRPGRNVTFANLRLVNFDDRDLWEWNTGGGFRWLNRNCKIVYGVNAYYDGRRTQFNNYHQIGVGFEALGEVLEFRLNTYNVTGNEQTLMGTSFVNPTFLARNIVFDRVRVFETALSGLDLEVGGRLPGTCRFTPSLYAGYYHYYGSNTDSVNGARLRGEAWISDWMSLHASLQHDQRFDTTFYGGIALHWGSPRPRFRGGVVDKLGARVVRDVNIVMGSDTYKNKEVALDPITGDPILVTHVASYAPPGGDGTVERPVQTLPQAQGVAPPGHIIFAHAGSVFTTDGIVLQNGQRFLGEGIQHLFTAKQGTFILPRATSNTALPQILNTSDCAVVLASNTEVAGFVINGTGCEAIFGENISNVIIRNNFISNAFAAGIFLVDVTGNITIANNVIDQTNGFGGAIEIFNTTGNASLTVENNRLSASTEGGVLFMLLAGDASLRSVIRGNTFDGTNSTNNINIIAFDNARVDALIENNSLTGANESIGLAIFGDAQASAIVRNNTITDTSGDGIGIFVGDNALANIQVARNTILNSSGDSIFAGTFGSGTLQMQIFGNTVNNDMTLQHGGSTFNLEGDTPLAIFLLGTNAFQGGATANVDPGINAIPFGSLGFPPP